MDFQKVDEFIHLVWQKDSHNSINKFNDVIFTDDGMQAVADGSYHCGGETGAIILYSTKATEIRTTLPWEMYHPMSLSYIPYDNILIIADGYIINEVVHPNLQKKSPFEIQHNSRTQGSNMFFFGITWMRSDKIAIFSYGKDTMGYVYIVNHKTENIIKTLPGDDEQEIIYKTGHLHTNSEGHLFVSDYKQNCIKAFDNSGEYIKTLSVKYPRGLCTDEEDNNIVVHDADQNLHPECDCVSVLSHQDGHLLKTLVTTHHNYGGWLHSVALQEMQIDVVAER